MDGELANALWGAAVGGAIGAAATWLGTHKAVKAARKDARQQTIGAAVSTISGACWEIHLLSSWLGDTKRAGDQESERQVRIAMATTLGRITQSRADLQRLAKRDLVEAGEAAIGAVAEVNARATDASQPPMADDDPLTVALVKSVADLIEAARKVEGLERITTPVGMDEGPPEVPVGAENAI